MQEQLKKLARGSPLLGASTELQARLMPACKGKPKPPMTSGPCDFSWEGCHARPLLHTGLRVVPRATTTTTAFEQCCYSAAVSHNWRDFLCSERSPNALASTRSQPQAKRRTRA